MLPDGFIQMFGSCAGCWLGCLSSPPNSPIPSRLEWASVHNGVSVPRGQKQKLQGFLRPGLGSCSVLLLSHSVDQMKPCGTPGSSVWVGGEETLSLDGRHGQNCIAKELGTGSYDTLGTII